MPNSSTEGVPRNERPDRYCRGTSDKMFWVTCTVGSTVCSNRIQCLFSELFPCDVNRTAFFMCSRVLVKENPHLERALNISWAKCGKSNRHWHPVLPWSLEENFRAPPEWTRSGCHAQRNSPILYPRYHPFQSRGLRQS